LRGTHPFFSSPLGEHTMSAPVHEIRIGPIKAAIWQNNTQQGVRHNVTVVRLYRKKTDEGECWADSYSFGRDDLPVVKEVMDQAWKWIYSHGQAKAREAA
jgi:hypothetical protein